MKWLADENFRNAIIRGILRQAPAFDIVRAQDVPELSGQDDLVFCPAYDLTAADARRLTQIKPLFSIGVHQRLPIFSHLLRERFLNTLANF